MSYRQFVDRAILCHKQRPIHAGEHQGRGRRVCICTTQHERNMAARSEGAYQPRLATTGQPQWPTSPTGDHHQMTRGSGRSPGPGHAANQHSTGDKVTGLHALPYYTTPSTVLTMRTPWVGQMLSYASGQDGALSSVEPYSTEIAVNNSARNKCYLCQPNEWEESRTR